MARIMTGSIFIIAAFLKLFSIDEFEIYIYSFNILSFVATTFVSRLLVAGELILGLFLILKRHYNLTRHVTLATLFIFTLFLVYTALFRNDDNCHCFGEFVKLNPLESILKNILIFGLMLAGKEQTTEGDDCTLSHNKRQCPWISSLIIGCILLIIFIVSPPDTIYNKIYSSEKEISSTELYESLDDVVRINFENYSISFDSTASFKTEGKQMIAIASSGCRYCKLGLKRLAMMMERGENDIKDIDIFIWGSPDGIMDFRDETMTADYPYWHIMPDRAIDITFGRFPIFIRLEDRNIVKVSDFRALTD